MIVIFFVLHLIWPDDVPFDYTVFLGGICGSVIAILNFFLMALTVQNVASMEDRDKAAKLMRGSYSKRLMLQCLWIVAVIFAPCFQLFAGILPLLFPSTGLKVYGLFRKDLKSSPQTLEATQTEAPSDEAPSDETPSDETPSLEATSEEADKEPDGSDN